MLKLRKSEDRGQVHMDWLRSWHTFSFGSYRDPAHVHHRSLRVINQDIIAPGGGFPPHPHEDMEIITYMIRGRLAHEDSTGTRQEIGPGEIQRMTAGKGIVHSEFNPSQLEEAELLQIWLFPSTKGLKPGYEQKRYDSLPKQAGLIKLASPAGAEGSVTIHQDTVIFKGELKDKDRTDINLVPERYGWLQLIHGRLSVNDTQMHPGDGLAIAKLAQLRIQAEEDAEFLFFDLG